MTAKVNGIEIVDTDTEFAVESLIEDLSGGVESFLIDMDDEDQARMYQEAYGGRLMRRMLFISDWSEAS